MGVTRFDLLPEKQLGIELQELRQAARERKGAAQRTGGASIAYEVSESAATFDWSGQVNGATANPTYGMAQFIVTLTSTMSEVPLADLAMVVYYSTDGSTWQEYTYERSMNDYYNFIAPELSFNLLELPGVANGPKQARFRIWMHARNGTRAAFKLQAVGTDAVTISVERTL